MSKGISNFQIEGFKNINDSDINDNFVDAFPAKQVTKFINFKLMISEKKGKYAFLMASTDSSDKKGTHWWSILTIEPKTHFFL